MRIMRSSYGSYTPQLCSKTTPGLAFPIHWRPSSSAALSMKVFISCLAGIYLNLLELYNILPPLLLQLYP